MSFLLPGLAGQDVTSVLQIAKRTSNKMCQSEKVSDVDVGQVRHLQIRCREFRHPDRDAKTPSINVLEHVLGRRTHVDDHSLVTLTVAGMKSIPDNDARSAIGVLCEVYTMTPPLALEPSTLSVAGSGAAGGA